MPPNATKCENIEVKLTEDEPMIESKSQKLPSRGLNKQNALVLGVVHVAALCTLHLLTSDALVGIIFLFFVFNLSTTMVRMSENCVSLNSLNSLKSLTHFHSHNFHTQGNHRLWTHKSYETSTAIKWILSIVNTGTVMHSIQSWASDHRMHHMYEDTHPHLDPYSITEGFFHAHVGGILKARTEFYNVRQLEVVKEMYMSEWSKPADFKLVKFNNKYYMPLMMVMAFGVPITVFHYYLKTSWETAWAATFLRIVMVWHSTWLVNSLAHWAGDKPFTEQHSSCENVIVSIFAMGEGYHNYHHSYPKDYRASRNCRGFNLSAVLLESMRLLGLVWDCKFVEDHNIEENPGSSIDFNRIKYAVK